MTLFEDMRTVVASMRGTFDNSFDKTFGTEAPYYMYGHNVEISGRLLLKDKNKQQKKYPLIALGLDVSDVERIGDIYHYNNLRLVICTETSKGLNAEERMEQVFIPTLIPLYKQLMVKIAESGLFMWDKNEDSLEVPPHKPVIRPYWGSTQRNVAVEQGNIKSIFNDPLDAIEILNLKLKTREKINC